MHILLMRYWVLTLGLTVLVVLELLVLGADACFKLVLEHNKYTKSIKNTNNTVAHLYLLWVIMVIILKWLFGTPRRGEADDGKPLYCRYLVGRADG